MSKLKTSDMLAQAFRAEGVDHLFTLIGDDNMYWSTAKAELPGVSAVIEFRGALAAPTGRDAVTAPSGGIATVSRC